MSKYEELIRLYECADENFRSTGCLYAAQMCCSSEQDVRDYERAAAAMHEELVEALENSLKCKGETGAIKLLIERAKAL